jgi:ubiquinone biosynthesis protein COQ4
MSIGRVGLALGGPDLAKKIARMHDDPVGRRVLADRPCLAAAMCDYTYLESLPEGSVGRAYLDFLNRPEVIPSNMLASSLYADGYFDSLPWTDDMKYLTERSGMFHDFIHVMSGYGTSLPAEAINIAFSIGLEGYPNGRAIVEAFSAFAWVIMWPEVGATEWRRLMVEGYQRGAAAAKIRPLAYWYIEELLPRPLDEVRREVGIFPTAKPITVVESWIRNPLGKALAHGYGGMAKLKAMSEVADKIAFARTGASPRAVFEWSMADAAERPEVDAAA